MSDTATHEANHLAVGIAEGGIAAGGSIWETDEHSGIAWATASSDAGMAAVYAAGGLADGSFKPGTHDYDQCLSYCKKAGIEVRDAVKRAESSLRDPAVRRGRDAIAGEFRKREILYQSEIEDAYWTAHGDRPVEKRSDKFKSCLSGSGEQANGPQSILDHLVYAVLPWDE